MAFKVYGCYRVALNWAVTHTLPLFLVGGREGIWTPPLPPKKSKKISITCTNVLAQLLTMVDSNENCLAESFQAFSLLMGLTVVRDNS